MTKCKEKIFFEYLCLNEARQILLILYAAVTESI